MTSGQQQELLSELYHGRVSRNRDVERFRNPQARRVHAAHRRLSGLIRDFALPGVEVRARWLENPGAVAIAVEARSLRYRRIAILSAWEAEFLAGLGFPLAAWQLGAGVSSPP